MKGIIDKELKCIITDKKACYDLNENRLIFTERPVTRYRKNGYLLFDDKNRNIGIVFMSDDKRAVRYGAAEIMFFKEYEKEFGSWRVIKMAGDYLHGDYLPFGRIERILAGNNNPNTPPTSGNNQYECTTEARNR